MEVRPVCEHPRVLLQPPRSRALPLELSKVTPKVGLTSHYKPVTHSPCTSQLARCHPTQQCLRGRVPGLSSRGQVASAKRKLKEKAKFGLVSASSGGEDKSTVVDAVTLATKEFKAACRALSADSFSSLPNDLKAELKDAGFAISSGPVLLEVGQELGEILLEMGAGMESAKASKTTDAAASLVARLDSGTVLPGSSQRAALGKRLKASGRFFSALGSSAPKEVLQFGKAMLRLGEELSKGSEERKVDAASVYGRKSLKIGSIEFEVTLSDAALGSVIAAVFSFLSWRLALVIDASGDGSYASEGANFVATSLRQTLLIVGYGSATLSLVTSVALAVLAFQLSSQKES